ncbi:F-box domain-containing protein [Rutstroemia sp. NJR-2017a BBW]|nr:F-box domain-containing protein [Rutstroemia sp. NJR-2017a BBW]
MNAPRLQILDLPPEIHLLITSHLIYPDALSLKHTSRYFNSIVDIDDDLQIEWLIERRRLHLDCPSDSNCKLGSDLRFCRGSVQLLMKRRREHQECEDRPGGRGCLVFGRPICLDKPGKKRHLGAVWRTLKSDRVVWVAAVVVVVLAALILPNVTNAGSPGRDEIH